MKFAVIETGGKQYRVAADQVLTVEKLDTDEGAEVTLDKVLLVSDGDDVKVGSPYVDGATVTAEALEQGRDDKKIVFRYKNKTRRGSKKGHRQHYTKLKITGING